MAGHARVDSVQKLIDFKTSLSQFSQATSVALDGVDTEVQQVLRWLKQDQYAHWKRQFRHWSDKLAQARLVLKSKKLFDETTLEGEYSYVDERKIIATADQGLAEAQDKLNKIQRWSRELEKEALSYKAIAQRLSNALLLELPNARAQIDRMADALEAYGSLAPPVGSPDLQEQTSSSMAMPHMKKPASEQTEADDELSSENKNEPLQES
jgi:hypothetical protein